MKPDEVEDSEEATTLDFITNFKAWLTKNEFTIESESSLKLINSKNKGEGRCIISTQSYEPDKLIYKIPYRHLINYRQSLKHPDLVELFEWCGANTDGYKLTRMDALYIYLISQRFNVDSELYGFIHSMPLIYDTPEYFDQSLIDSLPAYFQEDCLKRIEKLKFKYNDIRKLLSDFIATRSNEISDGIINLDKNLDYENFRWVFNSVNSRCFHLDDRDLCDLDEMVLSNKLFGALTKRKQTNTSGSFKDFLKNLEQDEEYNNNLCCLIPYVDMLNHCLTPNGIILISF